MFRLDRRKASLRLTAGPALLLIAATPVSPAEPGPRGGLRDGLASNVRIADPARAAAVRRALRGAFDSLAHPECQKIFADFRDASGRMLQQKLDALGESGQSYLSLVLFYEGSDQRTCGPSRGREISAVTAPGSRVVFICGGDFSQGPRPNPFRPEAIIIHEMLHSLGLGENPPTSNVITWQVFVRCAR